MSRDLRERIAQLPRERIAVWEEADRITSESKSEMGESHVVEHWKPLLIVLMGRAEGKSREEAEERYETLMEDLGLFTQAALEGEWGIPSAAGIEYIRPTRVATENLLAHYVRMVMVPQQWELEDWLLWVEQWRSGAHEQEESFSVDGEEGIGPPSPLLGHWEGNPETVVFAHAVITPSRLLLIWQEEEGSAARKIDIPNYRQGEERIYAGPNDIGLPFLHGQDAEGREFLHFEVRSEDPDLVKMEVGLMRSEAPAAERPQK